MDIGPARHMPLSSSHRFVHESGRAVLEIGYGVFDQRQAARVDASRVTCPMLVLAGCEDRMVPVRALRQVVRKYAPVSTYRQCERHAHWLAGGPSWERVADEVLSWLASLDGPTAGRDDKSCKC